MTWSQLDSIPNMPLGRTISRHTPQARFLEVSVSSGVGATLAEGLSCADVAFEWLPASRQVELAKTCKAAAYDMGCGASHLAPDATGA
eukprot:scaffold254473_cov32-Tisochrysis_lutea.AAC.1